MNLIMLDLTKIILAFLYIMFLLLSSFHLYQNIKNKKYTSKDGLGLVLNLGICTFGNFALYLSLNDRIYIFFWAFVSIFLISATLFIKFRFKHMDLVLVQQVFLLLTTGLLILSRIDVSLAKRQCVFILIGVIIFILVQLFWPWKDKILKHPYLYGYFGVFVLLFMTIKGTITNGAIIQLTFGTLSIQPAEFLKVIFLLFFAILFSSEKNQYKRRYSAIPAALHILILVYDKDLGTALIFSVLYLCMLYIYSGNPFLPGISIASAIIFTLAAYQNFSHVRTRIINWIDPWPNIDGGGYQIIQSLFAIGEGGFFGLGLGNGNPSTIPYVTTDFIFSAIAEEFGWIVIISIIVIIFMMWTRIAFLILVRSDLFGKYLTVGISGLFLVQSFIIMGGNAKFIPLTGVTLPFVSYGGSSMLSSFLLFSIIEAVVINPTDQENNTETAAYSDRIKMNAVKTVYISICILYSLLILYLCYFIIIQCPDILDNEYNEQQTLAEDENIRGSIYSSDGDVLAETVVNDDGTTERSYPYSEIFSHIIGYSAMSKSGLEKIYNFELSRNDQSLITTWNHMYFETENSGSDIYTTLSLSLQEAAWDALGDQDGAVIAMNPKTGEIYAMVSKPDYDPNTIEALWDTYNDEEESSGIFLNRALQGLYPPGSVFKILTTLEYLREYPDEWQDYSYDCLGSYDYYDPITTETLTIHCYHDTKHGLLNLMEAFANSCNTSFSNIGTMLNQSLYVDLIKQFESLGSDSIELPINLGTSDLEQDSSISTKLQTVIGQGETLVSPYQIALLTCAVANNGIIMDPYIVSEIKNADGNITFQEKEKELVQFMTEEESSILTSFMTEVVESGTATALSQKSYTVAGKTGSAEYSSDKSSHGWFTCFAPTSDPEIVITVIVENGGTGSSSAVPIAEEILDTYFQNR